MVAISSSQKKTVFAVIFLALIAAGVIISGRGGFSGLRSDVFNNPSFVCTNAFLVSAEVRYNRVATDIQKISAEEAVLQAKIQGWNADIRKNEVQIKKLEKEKKTAGKKERTLNTYIKKNCDARPMYDCNTKKKELQDVAKDIRQTQNFLTSLKTQSNTLQTNIQNATSSIKLLDKQIQEIKIFRANYEECNKTLRKPNITSFSPEVGSAGTIITIYGSGFTSQSTVLIGDNVIEVTPTEISPLGDWLKISFPQNALENFPSDIYSLRVNTGLVSNSVLFSIIPAATCTDSDGGINLYVKGFGYDGIKYSSSNPVYDHCVPRESNILREGYCRDDGMIDNKEYSCPHGCSDGACNAAPITCGNGVKEGAEQCDDGNTNNYDSCDNSCKKKEGITIDITDANPLDLDKKIGNDSQTVQSGDSAEFRVSITNNGDQDIDKIFVNSTSVYSCVGSVASYSSSYPSNWKNISVKGNGNPNDNILQVGETLEYTCTDLITKGSYTPGVELQANNKYFQDTTEVITLKRDEICEVVFGTKKYTLNPCSIDSTLIDGTGDKEFTFQIIPSESGVFSFSVYGYGEGFPTYGMIHSPTTGGSTGVVNITSKVSDSVLSVNQYSGYLPIRIRQDYQSGSIEKELRLGINLNVTNQ